MDRVVAPQVLEKASTGPRRPLGDRVPRPAQAIATSGATGTPKLIMDPNPGLFDPSTVEHMPSEIMGQGPSQVQLVPAPLYHTNGFLMTHNALRRDEQVVLMERFDAERAVQAIEDHRVTSVTMVPTMLLRIARIPGIDKRDLSSLQSVLQGGAACPPWLVRAWIELVGEDHFFMAYGSTERVGVTLIRGDEWLQRPGSVGRGLTTSIVILDETGRRLPPGQVGEIFMRKDEDDGLAPCEYRGAPPPRRTPDGFTSVGDLGWLDDDGYLYIADRRTDMIVTGGANVYPAEVESAVLEHPLVADVAVIGLPDDEWGSRVHAVVQPAEMSKPLTVDELDAHCRERLAGFKRPKSFELVSLLPRTEAGKLNRSSLLAERGPPVERS
jgi:bile acid-coenzyme A ligase